jgi:glycosyltransferase involved in cell wall biosynthesis
MKIIIPILGFGRAGGYRVLSNLANEWIKMGNEVVFLVNENNELPYFSTKAHIIWINYKGNKVGESSLFKSRGTKNGITNVLKNINSLRLGLNKNIMDSNVILANHSLTAFSVYLSRAKGKKVYYVQAYEPEYYYLRKNVKGYILGFVSTLTYFLPLDKIVNSPIYFKYKKLRAKKLVPPGIDFSIFYPKKSSIIEGYIIIGCIGRSEPDKGTLYVFEAVKRLIADGVKCKLKVAYGGIPNKYLKETFYEVVKPKNDTELADFYRSLHILVSTPLVQLGAPHYPIMEAMACGIATISTGHIPATESNSWIVPVKNASAIVEAVKKILKDQLICEAKTNQALEDIKAFAWSYVAKKMLEYF